MYNAVHEWYGLYYSVQLLNDQHCLVNKIDHFRYDFFKKCIKMTNSTDKETTQYKQSWMCTDPGDWPWGLTLGTDPGHWPWALTLCTFLIITKLSVQFKSLFTSGILYFFRSPVWDDFQWKFRKNFWPLNISLSMKRCPDNQINVSFIDISRIKWLIKWLLQSSFFRTTSTVASSEALIISPLSARTRSNRQHSGETSKTMDINPSLQICGWTSTEQVVDKGIRQKSTKEWTHSLTAVPFVRGHGSVFPWTPRNTCMYTCHPTNVTATCGVLTQLPAKKRMLVKTSADRRLKK